MELVSDGEPEKGGRKGSDDCDDDDDAEAAAVSPVSHGVMVVME